MVSTEHIDIRTRHGLTHAYITGTKFRVAQIYNMVINDGLSVDWIFEQFEVLDRAKVHAALTYYYDNPERIEREWRELVEDVALMCQESNATPLDAIRADGESHNKTP
jgi:uncharacterized protein (DUF433 family)